MKQFGFQAVVLEHVNHEFGSAVSYWPMGPVRKYRETAVRDRKAYVRKNRYLRNEWLNPEIRTLIESVPLLE